MTTNILDTMPDTLGTARYLGTFANQSPEWHAVRATGIGGSDVGTIVGCNPWESAYTWWAKRTGKIDSEIPQSDAMLWGTLLEEPILKHFASLHPELRLQPDCGTWSHGERPWQIANPDALYQRGDGSIGIVEVKTARYEDAWVDGVPAYYQTQVQWYLQTFGFSHAYVVVLFSGSKYREFEITADTFEQDTNLATVEDFRKYVETDTAPDFSAPFISTLQTVREQHPEIDDAEIELGDLGADYFKTLEEYTWAEGQLNQVKSHVLMKMGNAKKGLFNGVWVVTRQARNGGTPYLVNKKGN